MRQRTLILTSLALAVTGFDATLATAQEEYRHGHIRNVEAGVTLQRATEVTAEEAVPNLPFLPGDRVWTDAAGRAEFQFPEGTVVRVDRGSKLDYSDHDESRDERVVLRLWSGSLILRARAPESAIFEIETPGGLVQAGGPAIVRIDVEGGETQLSVYEGEASLDTGRDSVRLAAGERTWARWGDGPATPAPFDRYAQDDFGLWDGDLESRQAWAANSSRYLPQELEPYAPEFDTHGTWAYEEPVGYVWQPRVTAGWTPYTNGRWTWTSFGWTWVPYEPWGWAPHHYGRWGFSASLGWYWAPGTVWSGGWVSWGIGGGHVGWCALGWNNRPVVPWPHHRGHAVPRRGYRGPRGHAVPRGSIGQDRAWSVVRRGDLGRGGHARQRVDPGSVGDLRVAESVHDRPDRSARAFTRTAAVPRAASSRPRPGASSRAARGASPVPLGSTALGRSGARSSGAAAPVARPSNNPGRAPAATSGSAGARPRAGSVTGRAATSSARRSGSPSWVGSSRSNGSRSVARPSPSQGSSTGASTRSPGRGSPSGVTSRPRSSQPRSGGVSRSTRSAPRSSGVSSRPPSSAPRSSGVSSRPRTSAPRSSGVSSRSRTSAPRSSGVSSRPRSSAPRSSGVSSRSRSSAPRSSGGAASSSKSSGSRSSARSRGGSRKP